jgi:hypothetical protein
MLRELHRVLKERGVELHFAEMKDPVRDKLRRFELMSIFPDACFHPTIGSAVDAYVDAARDDQTPFV